MCVIPILSIVGKTNSGKTTLIEKLIPELKRRGYRVGTIKHGVRNFQMDHPGKDTWRHAQAGADSVAISAPSKLAVIKRVEQELSLDEIVCSYFDGLDIILAEGCKKDKKPKIEVFRSSVNDQPLCGKEDNLIALVSDKKLNLGVPSFTMKDIREIADLIEERFYDKERSREERGDGRKSEE